MENYPKIIFKYSWIYDQLWGERIKDKKNDKKYPSSRKILNYIKNIEKLWKNDEKKVLVELSRITGLKWKEDKIICYVVGKFVSFSDPLTMPIYKGYSEGYISKDRFIDKLIHEMIHRLFTQEKDFKNNKSSKSFAYFRKKYKKENWNTILHIIVHAIHSRIFLKFYNKKRLKREIKISSSFPDMSYKRSWEIVKREGYENIIREFTKRIK